jgi:hypothetical protein
MRAFVERHHRFYKRLYGEVLWDVDFPFFKPARCFHGGAFFDAIGTGFDSLEEQKHLSLRQIFRTETGGPW